MGIKGMYKDFGKLLSYLRVENGLTRNEVADRLGIAVNTYGQYERGDRKVPLSHAITLSKLLGFDLNDFINDHKSVKMNRSLGLKWYEEFSEITFTDEETDQLIEFAKYLLSKRIGETK